jgi:hypothetical protein
MRLRKWVLTAMSAAVISTPAFATTFIGTLGAGSTTWSGPDPTQSYYVGTPYQVFAFTVAANTSLTLTLTPTLGLDGVLSVYSGAFNAASPTTNRVTLFDGFGSVPYMDQGFANETETAFLTTVGTPTFFAVVSGNKDDPGNSPVGNSSFGTFSLSISPNVTAVPEPGEWAMLLAGLGMITAIARRRVTAAS